MEKNYVECPMAVPLYGSFACKQEYNGQDFCEAGYKIRQKVSPKGEVKSGGILQGLETPDILQWSIVCPTNGKCHSSRVRKLEKLSKRE